MHRRDFIKHSSLAALATAGARAVPASSRRGPLRVVQIGTAHAHAAEKWATLQRHPETFACLGICEPDAELQSLASGRAEYRDARWLGVEDLLARDEVEAAVIETELPDLLDWGRKCLTRGWHVHLDKPPGRSLGALSELQTLAAHQRCVLQMGYMYRYHPAFRFCLEAAREGWLGGVFAIHGEMGRVIDRGRRPWLAENYGGSMLFLGCHLLDLVVALLGRPDRVTAYRRRTFPERDELFDHETAVLEYPRSLATIRSMLAEVGGSQRRQFVVCGEYGTVEIRPLEPASVRLALQRPAGGFTAGSHDVPLVALAGRYEEQLLDFAGMARGGPSLLPSFTPAHDLAVQEVLLQAGVAR